MKMVRPCAESRPAQCPCPPLMAWRRRGLHGARPKHCWESRHAGPAASPDTAVPALPGQSGQCRQCKGRQSGRGTATFQHALPGATLRVKRSGRTTSNMFSTSNVDSQRGASEGLVWFVGTGPQHGDGGCKLGCGEAGDRRVVGHGFKTRSLPTVSLHPGVLPSSPFLHAYMPACRHKCMRLRMHEYMRR